MCPSLQTSVRVSPQRSLDCNSRHAVQTQPNDQSGPYLSRFSTSGAQDGPGHLWSFLQPGSITDSQGLFSPVPNPTAWTVDTLSLPWENLAVYTFPPVSLLGHIISKMMDQGCRRMIRIAPGWPDMP